MLESGRVFGVCKYVDGQNEFGSARTNITCPCHKCKTSDAPSNIWWELHIETAAHVIQDEDEAQSASLRLFFDDKESPRVTRLVNLTIKQVNSKTDRCHLKCTICDIDLGDRLEGLKNEICEQWTQVHTRYSAVKNSDTFNRLTVIVSHPHGCTKAVAIGNLMTVNTNRHDHSCSKYKYTTSTCPGSSGAYVFIPGHTGLFGKSQPVHQGLSDDGYNYSEGWVLRLSYIGVERVSAGDKKYDSQ